MPAEDGDRRDDEADRSTLDRPTLLSVAGGDGGLQDGGGAFNPAILFSEINFLKLLNSSTSSEPVAAASGGSSGTSLSSSPAGGGGGGGGSGISSVLALLFLRSGFELAPLDFELLLLGTVFGRLLRLLFWGLRLFDCLVLLADLTSILCTKLVGDTPDIEAAGAPSGGIRSPWGCSSAG